MSVSLKIFIEIPTWLGDAVMTTPAIENIVKKYSDAKLIIYGSYVSTRLFVHHPNVEKILLDESKQGGFRYLNLYRDAKSVGKVDMAFSFRKNFTTQYLLFFIGVKERFIYKRFTKKEIHQVERYNNFVHRSIGSDAKAGKLKIYGYSNGTSSQAELGNQNFELPSSQTEFGNQSVALGKNASKKLLGLNPGATYGSAKRWYPEEFAKVATALSSEYDIIIFGGPNEGEIAQDIENILIKNGVSNYKNLATKTSVPDLFEGIASLDLFVTNDSGPMHLAAAYQVPTISIFGPTRYKETSQWMNEKSILIRKDLECSPCMKRTCPLEHHECMKLITAQDVLDKIKEIT